MNPKINYVTPAEAFKGIKSNDRIFVQGSACTPVYLLQELAKEADAGMIETYVGEYLDGAAKAVAGLLK